MTSWSTAKFRSRLRDRAKCCLQVLAAGVNNTEINTRPRLVLELGVTGSDQRHGRRTRQETETTRADGGWNEATPFPFIQGTDCCAQAWSRSARRRMPTLG